MTKLSSSLLLADFDRTTSLTPSPDEYGTFSVELDPGWSSLVGIHGGYMSAIAARGAEALAPDRELRTITTSFLSAGQVGPATLTVRAVRRGRSMSTMVAELSQDDRLLIVSRMTLMTERTGVEWTTPVDLDIAPRDQCVPLPSDRSEHFSRAEGLLDPAHVPFTGGDRAVVRGHIRPAEGRGVDPAWLAMASDWFPPPAFVRIEPPVGGVSVDLTTHIHRPHPPLGDDDWLAASFEVEHSAGGLAVEHGIIADGNGMLVAESFQTRLTVQD